MEHQSSPGLPSSLKSYDVARRRDRELREEKSWSAVSLTMMTDSLHSHNSNHGGGVAPRSPQQSRGEDADAESKQTPRKGVRPIRYREEMDSGPARGLAPYPGDAGGSGAIRQSSADAADADRTGRRDVVESAKVSAPLSLDRSAADS